MSRFLLAPLAILLASCATVPPTQQYDLVIRNGTIVDGSGGAPYVGDVGDPRRPDRRGRAAPDWLRAANHRRDRPDCRAGLHQHAQLGD